MSRRIKRINISPMQIIRLFMEPSVMEKNNIFFFNNYYLKGLPDDVEVINATYDLTSNSISLFIRSESFEEIPIYAQIPILEMEVEIIKKVGRYRKDEPYRPLL